MNVIEIIEGEDPLQILRRCEGYYEQPVGGPLVGYNGRYGSDQKQFVGKVYVNFAKAERHGDVLFYITDRLVVRFAELIFAADGFCAAPEGGKALGATLAMMTSKGYIFPEKEVIEPKSESSRERSRLIWGRNEPEVGEHLVIVEDICHNFSTTEEMILLIESRGAHVDAIICFLNRSDVFGETYRTKSTGKEYPIKALISKPIKEYTQEDPEVLGDIAAGNVIWKPKNDWRVLAEAMTGAAVNMQQRHPD